MTMTAQNLQQQTIQIERQPSNDRLEAVGARNWPIWERDMSEFPWTYDQPETCYLITGTVTVTPENGEPVTFRGGDLVQFPAGMSCTWKIDEYVKKRYHFG